jgi:hypothetical protein
MHIALHDLKLKHLFVVYPGKVSYPLDRQADVVSIGHVPDKLAALC